MREFFEIPEGYSCPFCPDHKDEDFFWDRLLNTAICEGCTYDILNYVTINNEPDKKLTDIIEDLTGRPYEEYQLRTLVPVILWDRDILIPENLIKEIKKHKFDVDEAKEYKEELIARLAYCRDLRKDIKSRLKEIRSKKSKGDNHG